MNGVDLLNQLLKEFNRSRPALTAIGDPSRQAIIAAMTAAGCHNGQRVGDLTKAVNLSRPTVSHHIKLLREAGMVRLEKVGTKHYYYLTMADKLDDMTQLLATLKEALKY